WFSGSHSRLLGAAQSLRQHVSVGRGQSHAAQRGQRWSNVRRRRRSKIFAALDPPAHQQQRNTLVVEIWRAVARAVATGFSNRFSGTKPVRFRSNEQIAAASGEIAQRLSVAQRALRRRSSL